MKRTISSLLALVSVVTIVYVDIEMAVQYNQSDGKTQALFLPDLLQYGFRYLLIIPELISLGLAYQIYKSKMFRTWDVVMVVLTTIALIGTMTPSWKLLI